MAALEEGQRRDEHQLTIRRRAAELRHHLGAAGRQQLLRRHEQELVLDMVDAPEGQDALLALQTKMASLQERIASETALKNAQDVASKQKVCGDVAKQLSSKRALER